MYNNLEELKNYDLLNSKSEVLQENSDITGYVIVKSWETGRYSAINHRYVIDFIAHLTENGGLYTKVTSVKDSYTHKQYVSFRFLRKWIPVVRDLGHYVKTEYGLPTLGFFLK